ncbi:hypothetical protein [Pseudoxanthomonas mexicana]|uniref:hypothetical protein n=1 Tax=Pseudoxanthomonas mexicana TaxID=128785 RepID=UPI0028B1588D|nr:hypothetical protein [Pseudoxanthomonas mexicana]
MHPDCILEVAAAIGRTPTAAEVDAFEAGLLSQMRELARTEPNWKSMTGQQRLQAAAAMAQEAALQAADTAAQRKASNLLAQAREVQRMGERAATLAKQGTKNAHHAALFERMRQADDYVAGVRNEALSNLIDAVDAVSPRFLGLMDDPAAVRSFARAVMDGKADTPEMGKAAKAYTDALEALRQRANAAGTDIGQLDYGYLPQPHDTGRVSRAGAEQWAQDVLPRLARERYVDAAGQPMGDDELLAMLRGAWESIATEGRNQRVPGQRGGGSRASRFDDKHRAIHFRDADAYLDYLGQYGRGSMMDAIHGHVGQMAKTIGLMEEFGANPTSTFRLLKDTAEQADNAQGVTGSFATLDMVWDTLNGTTAQPVDAGLARFWQGVRNFTTAAKLQGVMLSSITDAPLQVLVARSAGVPMGQAMKSVFTGFGGKSRAQAHRLALGMDEIAGEMARWHQDHLAQGWTSKLANTTMKLTLVEGWSNALRRGYALTLSHALEQHRRTDWSALDEFGRRRLESAGVTEADWKVWQKAKAVEGMLTKDGIRAVEGISDADANRAVARLLGYLDQEARTAVLSPDLSTRAMIQQGTKSGTWGGEILRSVMLFKSFPMAVVDKHLRRIRNIPTAQGKVAYSVAMMSSLQLFGAVALQLKDIAAGKDPRDMTTGKFWLAAAAQGGGLGIFGDILYTGMGGNARGGQANWTSMAGPVFGTMMDAADLTMGNAARAAQGKEVDFGADLLRFTKGNTPLINLWYLRAAVDHMLLHDLQEELSPGYLRRMRKRSQKDWGQDYWWQPGDKLPDRAPEPAAAVGE